MARVDGSTDYMRPLPGGERMYPETDVKPFVVSPGVLGAIELPETWEAKKERLSKSVPADIVDQIIKSEYLVLFEELAKRHDPKVVATILTSTVKDMRRKGVPVENLTDGHFNTIFTALDKGTVSKEALPELLEYFSNNPEGTLENCLKDKGLGAISDELLRKLVREVIAKNPQHAAAKNIGPLMGDVMKLVRGKADGAKVAKFLKEELG